jgi:ribosomal protein S18 acetylase RimI-like enzyme
VSTSPPCPFAGLPAPAALPAGLRLRRAGVDDAPAVAAFAARAFRDTYGAESGTDDVEAYVRDHLTPTAFSAELADQGAVVLVAESDHGQLAGYVQLRAGQRPESPDLDLAVLPPGAFPIEVARLYVDRPWHGRGVAAALLGQAVAAANALPDACVWLSVYQRNPRAVAFYRKRGLVVAGTQTFDLGRDRQLDWVMAWRPAR